MESKTKTRHHTPLSSSRTEVDVSGDRTTPNDDLRRSATTTSREDDDDDDDDVARTTTRGTPDAMDRFAFFAAMPFLIAMTTTTTTTTSEDGDDESEDIFTGVSSFSVSSREQYGDDDDEDDDENDDDGREREGEAKGFAARDARHLVFALTEKYTDLGGCVETVVRLRHMRTRGEDDASGSSLNAAPNAAYLEIELDGAAYGLCTKLAKKVVVASGNQSGSVEDVVATNYVSVIFPHVTLNIYSTTAPTDWTGHGSLNALARALKNAAFSVPPRRAHDVDIDPIETVRLQRHATDVLIDAILRDRHHEVREDDDVDDDDMDDDDMDATVDGRVAAAARLLAACPKPYFFDAECEDKDRSDEYLLLSLDDRDRDLDDANLHRDARRHADHRRFARLATGSRF